MGSRLLFVLNDADFFISHRVAVAVAARNAGYEVHVATAPGPGAEAMLRLGFAHHSVPLSRSGRNPFNELKAVHSLIRLMADLRPNLVHLVTIKPVVYGGIAARLCRVPGVVAAISGLGHLFTTRSGSGSLLRALITPLYRFALGHRNLRVIFQNFDDQVALSRLTQLPSTKAAMIRGSGVNLEDYMARPEPPPPLVVTFASRLLKSKGVAEFVAAARRLRQNGCGALFWVIGKVDTGNPLTVTEEQLEQWRAEGDVEIIGQRDDIPEIFARSHIVVLPSYYGEGLPKVLLEAASCGRPVVTTDHPGCRDAVEPGVTGLLVPIRDAAGLADAIEELLRDQDKRNTMGLAARRKAEREFSIDKVVNEHLRIYTELESAIFL